MTVQQFVDAGDSFMMNTGGFSYAGGGTGTYSERFADMIGQIPGIGPRLGPGIRLTALGRVGNPVEWTFSGAHTNVVAGNAFNKCVYSGAPGNSVFGFRYMTAQTSIDTWTKPAYMPTIGGGIAVDWIDMAGGGRGQMSINGAAYAQIPDTPLGNNSFRRFYLSNSGTAITSMAFRGFDGSSDCNFLIHDVEPYYVVPQGALGWINHNMAINGSLLHELVTSTSGDDPMAILDSVVLGSGSPIAPTPNAGMFTINMNDITRASASGYVTDLGTLHGRVSCPFYVINPWEAINSSFSTAQQTAYRNAVKASGLNYYDIYDAWAAMGITGNAQASSAGFIIADGIHPTQAAHVDIAPRLFGYARRTAFSTTTAQADRYSVHGKPATRAVSAKVPTVAYSAGQPVVPV